MSISTEITRIQTARNTIRAKAVELGIGTGTDTLDKLATAIEGIENRGAVSAEVQEGATYTIPKGYHNGSGTVSGVAGGGNYKLQSKTATPTKAQQNITPDSGFYGLSDVTVSPIPDTYQDVSAVTAGAGDVLTGKIIVDKTGKVTTGTMPNNGTVTQTLTTAAPSYTVPKGFHSGTGVVKIVPETKTATPTKSAQTIEPTEGKVLSSVEVAAIPEAFQDVTGVTAVAGDVLTGKKIVSANGTLVTGSMANNGSVAGTIDGLTQTSYTVLAGYTSGGTVSLSGDIEEALAAI
uniref:Uncharacterized protein n=1 Tax=Myoviridae sp. ctZDd15 TaxID=2826664 RepID=A0A8S5M0Q8_9CAUD|nr:MAG TPA: hypothetical protein [Myoviridae sp. ctZDd15]